METLQTIFLACFGFGALFTVGSLVLGMAGGFSPGHGAFHAGGGAHVHGGAAHTHVGGHAAHAPHAGGHLAADDQPGLLHAVHGQAWHGLPLLNPSSALGFLTWFGAAGYLLLRYAEWAVWAVLLGALLAGAIIW